MGAVSFTASELLVIWEDAHGELSPEWREGFLADERVQELTRLDTFIARPAIERNQKLISLSKKPTLRSRGAPRGKSRERQRRTLAAGSAMGTFRTSPMLLISTSG